MNHPNTKLWQCSSFDEQKEWCKHHLLAGETLTDPQIWLGGADPDRVIRSLRRDGMKIKTIHVLTIDAGGEEFPRTLAWKIDEEGK